LIRRWTPEENPEHSNAIKHMFAYLTGTPFVFPGVARIDHSRRGVQALRSDKGVS